jgi:hypothetical protein
MYNEKENMYYYKCKGGTVDASKYFLKGDNVGSLTEGSLKKQCRKMLVGGSGSGSNKDFEAEAKAKAKELKAKELEAKEKEEEEAYNQIVQFDSNNNNNNNNNNDNNNNKCDDAIQEILSEYFDTDENTRKEKAINTVKKLTTKITSALCQNNYNNDWTKKKGGNPPKKDLKTFLSKLRILIKEFE